MFPFTSSTYDVRDKVVLITGAGSGIGAATAAVLHRRGACVALVDIDDVAVKDVAATLGERALALGADVRDRAAMTDAVRRITEHFGRVDVVVADAGIAPEPATVRTTVPADFDRIVEVNLTGVFNTVHPALEQVIRNAGHVVIVSSVAAFLAGPGMASYAASKAAVEQLGRALRVELAAVGASVGVAYFGFVRTQLMRPLEDDPVGRRLDALMPWPFNQRISPERAAAVIADGIAHRSPSTIAPLAWRPYALLRGVANVLLDDRAAASGAVRDLIRTIEQRAGAL